MVLGAGLVFPHFFPDKRELNFAREILQLWIEISQFSLQLDFVFRKTVTP